MAPALDARSLADEKARLGLHVSVCLPARNEAPTVGGIIATVRGTLAEGVGLVDEVGILDDGSDDETPAVASAAGGRVFPVAEVLPELPAGECKGNALWKSLFVSEGDLVCFLDADVRNFAPHFVTRLLEPLLVDRAVG